MVLFALKGTQNMALCAVINLEILYFCKIYNIIGIYIYISIVIYFYFLFKIPTIERYYYYYFQILNLFL